MKKLIYIIPVLVTLSSLFLVACDNPLDENNLSGLTADNHYTTPDGFNDLVNASYENVRGYYGTEWGNNMDAFGTDEYTNGGHGSYHYMNQYTAGLNSESGPIETLWNNFYQAINTVNTAVNRAGNIEMSEDEKNSKLAEVRFLRAYYYFKLVQHFGPVPLTLEETEGVETEAERTSEDVVYTAIEDDLQFAIQHLPVTQDEFGRVTEPAAKHLLSLVLLTRGYKDFAEPDDYSRAADLADDIINNNNYNFNLLDDFDDVFVYDERHEEVIWSVQFADDPLLNSQGNHSHLYYSPWYSSVNNGGMVLAPQEPGYGRSWIRFRPTQWSLENFRPLNIDSRYEKSFQNVWHYNSTDGIPEGAAVGDTAIWVTDQEVSQEEFEEIESRLPGITFYSWNINDQNDNWFWDNERNMYPGLTKYDNWTPTVESSHGGGGRDVMVYRLAETYLIAAEALLMDGKQNEAVDYINTVRKRAAYPNMEDQMTINSADVDIDFILDERSRELMGEQKRWLDLKRTGKLIERVRLYNPDASNNIQEYHTLRPIPATQITRTQNEFPQNPGY